MATLTDNSPMPFGVHKGEKMANVPAAYLMWLYNENKCNREVQGYIEDNLDVLKEEIKRNDQKIV
jgi:uncharacterized protein (DUF3820 family)